MRRILLLLFIVSFFTSSGQEHISDGTKIKTPKGFVKYGSNSWKNSYNDKESISIRMGKGDKTKKMKKSSCEELELSESQFVDYKSIKINGESYDVCLLKRGNRMAMSLLTFYINGGAVMVGATANPNDYERSIELITFMVKQFKTTPSNQNKVIFNDGKSVNVSVLNRQLINVVGESNFLFSKSTTERFLICFFGKIASSSSYKTYQEDLIKAKNFSKNIDERTYFLYKITYINSALWTCMDENPELLKEYSKGDKIIPQSDEKIGMFGLEILADLKKEMGVAKYTELESKVNLESYSECFARKLWDTFTPKEMFNMSPKNEKRREKLEDICLEENLNIPTLDKKYDSDYIADSSLLAEYISFINDPKSKGLDFKIKSPKGFVNTFANSPNIIRLWRKENEIENDDPWIYILILNEKTYESKIDFEKDFINEGWITFANELPGSSNFSYFSADDYPGMIYDSENSNGVKSTMIFLWLPNHIVHFSFAERRSDNYNYYRNILISFAKSVKFL